MKNDASDMFVPGEDSDSYRSPRGEKVLLGILLVLVIAVGFLN